MVHRKTKIQIDVKDFERVKEQLEENKTLYFFIIILYYYKYERNNNF